MRTKEGFACYGESRARKAKSGETHPMLVSEGDERLLDEWRERRKRHGVSALASLREAGHGVLSTECFSEVRHRGLLGAGGA